MLCVTATSLLLVILLALCTLQIRVSLGNGPPVDLLQRRALSEAIHMETVTYKIHPFLERNFLDWNQMDLKHRNNNEELPVFWHILKSGGTTIKLMYAQCYNLVEACETGLVVDQKRQHTPEMTPQEWISQQQQTNAQHLSGGGSQTYLGASSAELTLGPGDWMQQQAQTPVQDHGSTMISPAEWFQQQAIQASEQQLQQGYGQRRLQTDELSVVESEDGRRYVNVDVTTPEGIAHAAQLGFAASPALTDVMFTPLLVDGAGALLNRNGRLFSVFRHPVLRVVSNFYYLQNAIWEPTYDEVFATWTIDDYAKSEVVESNWMVRSLLNKMVGRMEPSDILVAKETLKQKCLVGLIDDMEGTIRRFHDYFGFGSDDSLDCALQNFSRKQSGSSNSHNHPQLDPTSETWALLSKKNQLDLELFTYAKQLFVEQGQWLKEGRRWIETKKFHHNDPPRNP
mmetsp:Transcript_7877/g.16802  ORF Transcript_7877/g.16802 Transcript_7877/m.16802 type:complete len:455 (+) Transcript_7877:107-1471(+)